MDSFEQKTEHELLDTLHRILKAPDDYWVMYVYMSRLLLSNHDDNKVAIVLHMLEKISSYEGRHVFKLENQDVVLIVRHAKMQQMEELMQDFRSMFPRDPAITENPPDYFVRCYNLREESPLLLQEIERTISEEKRQVTAVGTPISPENLDEVISIIKKTDIIPSIRKQEVFAVISQKKMGLFFQEFFTSINSLAQNTIPAINFLADNWLFQHLTETLDIKMLENIFAYKEPFATHGISLNLNLITLRKPEFKKFSEQLKEKGISLIVELQPRDIFYNTSMFIEAKKTLREMGHKVLLDGITQNSLFFLDPDAFACDFVKIVWSDLFKNAENTARVRELAKTMDSNKLILCRCDDEEALKWGMANKIKFFQGNVVDRMLGGAANKFPVWDGSFKE